jgi:hypothetical protein
MTVDARERREVMASVRRWEHQGSLPVDHGRSILHVRERAVMPVRAHRGHGQDLALGRDLAHRVRADRQGQVARRQPAKLHGRNAPPHGDVAADPSILRRRKAQ